MTTAPTDSSVGTDEPPAKEHYGLELLALLGVSLGYSGIKGVLDILYSELAIQGGVKNTVATVVESSQTTHPVFDFFYTLLPILGGLAAPLLALVLLARRPGGPGFGVGFDRTRFGRELAQGVGFLALIGIPGLGLVWAAHSLGIAASLDVVNFPAVWYRVPMLLLSAFQNGFAEEIIVTAFMLTRLRQIGWSKQRALLASATLRGSYHLYQGFGGFAGNFVMGLVFGFWFQRTRRVIPLVVAHFLLDAFSFVGFVYLHSHISWI